jgi:hypothetical protein
LDSLESEMLSEVKERFKRPTKIKDRSAARESNQALIQSVGRASTQESKCKRKATPQCPSLIDRLIVDKKKGYFEGKDLIIVDLKRRCLV